MLKSLAVLSSALCKMDRIIRERGSERSMDKGGKDVHLPASEDQTLLLWRHARLLLDLLLNACDLIISPNREHSDRMQVRRYRCASR